MAQTSAILGAASPAPARPGERSLFSPAIDFFGLGGASLIYFAAIFLFFDKDVFYPALTVSALWLANLINHPHFAHSYQIFYRNFRGKLTGADYPRALRLRYLFAGLLAPIALAVFLLGSFAAGRADLLGLSASLMFFLVGWHYVKQGYGMAMVDAALKKQFFKDHEKKALLFNAYATWIFAWIFINRSISEQNLLGLEAYVVPVPDPVYYIAAAAAGAAFIRLGFALGRGRFVDGRKYPINGLVAYAVSLYPWMFFREVNPLYFAFVPAFHSLQYLTVVWRYELNVIQSAADSEGATNGGDMKNRSLWKLARFYLVGVALGALGFWVIPYLLTDTISYDKTILGGFAFFFIFWVFINIHHYLMDNVMWRKDNPDVAKNLFGAGRKKAA